MDRSTFDKRKAVKIALAALVVLVLAATVSYSLVSIPTTFTSGSTISASQVNNNFKTLGDRMGAYKYQSIASTSLTSPCSAHGDLGSITVSAPANGYIVVRASASYVAVYPYNVNTNSYAKLCLSSLTSSCNAVYQYFYQETYGSTGSTSYGYFSPNLEYYFYVGGAGSYTYYLTGCRDTSGTSAGNPYVYAPKMTATFIPSLM